MARRSDLGSEILAYLQEHPDKPVSLPFLAHRFHMTVDQASNAAAYLTRADGIPVRRVRRGWYQYHADPFGADVIKEIPSAKEASREHLKPRVGQERRDARNSSLWQVWDGDRWVDVLQRDPNKAGEQFHSDSDLPKPVSIGRTQNGKYIVTLDNGCVVIGDML